MPRNYDVIIIGAGIIGLSIAYYLQRKQQLRVLVLEKEPSWITGSSARANGGFRQQFSTAPNIRLSRLSLPVFASFAEQFDIDISFRQHGYLMVTATPEGETALRRNLAFQRSHGVPVHWLEPEEIGAQIPLAKTEDLRGGTFCPEDGYADSYSIAEGFGKRARDLGAHIETDQRVVKVLISAGRVRGVETPGHRFLADRVVNAAGPHAAQVALLAGLDIPVRPVRRMMVMTEDFPALSPAAPMFVDIDTGFLMRPESGKVLMGWADPEEPAGFNLTFDPAFVEVVAGKAVQRVPPLEQARINPRRCWAGLYAVTPDHHCILGATLEPAGFFLANGFSGHGMMHAPAVGMVLADLILEGETELLDLHPLRPPRFQEQDLVEETVVL